MARKNMTAAQKREYLKNLDPLILINYQDPKDKMRWSFKMSTKGNLDADKKILLEKGMLNLQHRDPADL